MPEISAKKTVIASSSGESKKPKLASWLEKPPRETVLKAWMRASSQPMPPRP